MISVLIVLCNIQVVIMIGTVPVMTKAQVEGVVIRRSEFNYLVDFSKEAIDKKYRGDYSKVLVNKNECI